MRRAGFTGAVLAVCLGITGVWSASAGASGAAQGPPAGPIAPPFVQCPAIGLDSACEFLVDVYSADPAVAPRVFQDYQQGYYDGNDDVTVAVQNDSSVPVSTVHLGVNGSGQRSFSFDGDGLCNPPSGPAPVDCPFGPPGNNNDPFDYYGPDTVLAADSGTTDAGTVSFPTPLQPGQFTYLSLEAPTSNPELYAGGNTAVTTSLNDGTNSGQTVTDPVPTDTTDTATILGPNSGTAGGTVTYKVYSDPNCTSQVGAAAGSTKPVAGGVAMPSDPVGVTAPNALANDATYYWQVTYSGDPATMNNPAVSTCGNEVMTFGTPPGKVPSSVATALSGGGQSGAKITVPPNTPVTDNATVSASQPPTGRLTYYAFSSSSCSGSSQVKGVGGGGFTAGTGPPSSPMTLPTGTYYLLATYSGNAKVASSSSGCGAEVLTVASATVPPPSSNFTSVGSPQVNRRTGAITVIVNLPFAGHLTVNGVVPKGATLARKKKKCRRGFIKKRGRCVNNGPVVYGTAGLGVSKPGTYSATISPSAKVRRALKRGKRVNVSVTTTAQNSAGGAPVSHVQGVSVKLKKAKKHKKK